MNRAQIIGTGKSLPEKVLTNSELEKMVATTDEWIRSRTGIRERRIAKDSEPTSVFAIEAAKEALANAGMGAEKLDAILVATCTPDMAFPSVGCLVQKALGAKNAWALDLSAACSGFIFGLATAKSYIESGLAKNILLIGVDTLSRITDWKDRSTCVLFGDGAGAAVLTGGNGEAGILSVYLASDGNQAEILQVPNGAIQMEGPEVYKFAVTRMVEAAAKALELAGIKAADLRLIIPHQANLRIIESVAKRLSLNGDSVFVNVEKYGNMSAATTIVALDEAQRAGRLRKNDLVELVAFGAGLTWGAAVIRW